ncbi:MAG TPA: hypothetical protein VG206_21545 [Terriglobia bacterium]|nr:hypothetical protein [Terriglobia bacterium]
MTNSSSGPSTTHQYSTPAAGWRQNTNCAGTNQSAACAASPYHMFDASDTGGNGQIFAINTSTLALTRIDSATFTGSNTTYNLIENWSSIDPNRFYSSTQNQENNLNSHVMAYKYYEWNPAVPGPQNPVNLLAFNAGPSAPSADNASMAGGAAMLNGLLTVVGLPAITRPYICDGSTCTPTGGPTSACGSTANCIQVSTAGGAISGKVNFTLTEDAADAAGLLHEQNIGSCNNCFTSYTFTAATGSIISANAPAENGSPAGVNWHLYAETINGNWVNTENLALQQFQAAYSSTVSCSGSGGGACPVLPLTHIVTTLSATNHMNLSCETNGSTGAGCWLGQVQISKDDTKFMFDTGGLGQGLYEVVGVWDTTKGVRWIDLSTGLIHNGLTDAAGVSCSTATDCWTAPTGPLTWIADPNDPSLAGSSYAGMNLHELWGTLDGRFIAPQPQAGQTGTESYWLWDSGTTNVYVTSIMAAASNTNGHDGTGWQWMITANAGNPSVDSDDNRGHVISTSTTGCSQQQYPTGGTLPCLLNYFSYSNGGPCALTGPCTFPAPNQYTTQSGYIYFGIARQDVHYSAIHQVPGDPYPFLEITYDSLQNYTVDTIANGGCQRNNNVATVQVTAGYVSLLPGDQVSVTCTSDSSFNNATAVVTALTWTATGTRKFSYANTGPNVGTGVAGGGSVNKTDNRPARAWENEVMLQSHDGSGRTWRFAHDHYDVLAGPTNTGPNASISQDGHFAVWTVSDGTRSDVAIAELH